MNAKFQFKQLWSWWNKSNGANQIHQKFENHIYELCYKKMIFSNQEVPTYYQGL